jgi:hypothetical protein
VQVRAKAEGKVMTKDGVEYLQVGKIKTQIQVGGSSIKVSDKDDTRGLLSEYRYLIVFSDPIPGFEPWTTTPAPVMEHTPS